VGFGALDTVLNPHLGDGNYALDDLCELGPQRAQFTGDAGRFEVGMVGEVESSEVERGEGIRVGERCQVPSQFRSKVAV